MAQYTDEELDARDDGRSAYEDGKPVTTNPHSLMSAKNLYTCWEEGWKEARDEANDTDGDDEDD